MYILTKTNEDCFNCFNRLSPKRYSVFQFSKYEIAEDNRKMRGITLENLNIEHMDTEELEFYNDSRDGTMINTHLYSAASRFTADGHVIYPCIHEKMQECEKCEKDKHTHNMNMQASQMAHLSVMYQNKGSFITSSTSSKDKELSSDQ